MSSNSRIARYEKKRTALRIVVILSLSLIISASGIYFLPQIILGTTSLVKGLNKSTARPSEIKTDSIAPLPPKIGYLPKATADNAVDIEFFAEEGTTLKAYLNGNIVNEIKIGNTGSAIVKNFRLTGGFNEIYATTTDKYGNTSHKSDVKSIDLKTVGPVLELKSEVDKEKGKIKISGSTDRGAVVNINGRRVIVSRNGNFSKEITLTDGENIFKVKANDTAGNTVEEDIVVGYSVEE